MISRFDVILISKKLLRVICALIQPPILVLYRNTNGSNYIHHLIVTQTVYHKTSYHDEKLYRILMYLLVTGQTYHTHYTYEPWMSPLYQRVPDATTLENPLFYWESLSYVFPVQSTDVVKPWMVGKLSQNVETFDLHSGDGSILLYVRVI